MTLQHLLPVVRQDGNGTKHETAERKKLDNHNGQGSPGVEYAIDKLGFCGV